MADKRLTDEVANILRNSKVTANSVQLPPGQLPRELYMEVNKALTNIGGKWNTSAKAHLFAFDPRPKIAEMLGTGVSVDEKKKFQAFFTPPEVARLLVLKASVEGKSVLEPSAGEGALAEVCREAGCEYVHCIELNPEFAQKLEAKKFPTTNTDFLKMPTPKMGYDVVVMNPPFTKNQDIKHVTHAMNFVREGGVLVAIMMGNSERPAVQKMVKALDFKSVSYEAIPAGAFKESGTPIETFILVGTK